MLEHWRVAYAPARLADLAARFSRR
jgi:hypothetical protein